MTDAPTHTSTASASDAQRAGRRPPSRTGLRVLTALAALVCSAVVTQVFLAGLGLLVEPRYLAWHSSFVHIIELAVIAMVVVALLARGGARLAGLSAFTLLLIGTQYALIHGFDGPIRALHAVNAFALFAASWTIARQSAAKAAEAAAIPAGGTRRAASRSSAGLGAYIALLAGASILLAGMLPLDGAAPQSGEEPGAIADVGTEGPELGASVFSQNCAGCHGASGQGAVGPRLAGNDDLRDRAFVERRVREGEGIMPAFAGRLSDEQIAAVVDHVTSSWGNDL